MMSILKAGKPVSYYFQVLRTLEVEWCQEYFQTNIYSFLTLKPVFKRIQLPAENMQKFKYGYV